MRALMCRLRLAQFESCRRSCLHRAHKRDVGLRALDTQRLVLSAQDIADRIEKSRLRRESYATSRVGCPGCTCSNFSATRLYRHMLTCCPDLISDAQEWETLSDASDLVAVRRLLEKAAATERSLRAQVIRQAFHQTDEAENPIIRTPAQFAVDMRLPERRCANLLRHAIKDTPMPGDPEPVDVVYEDDHLVVVNKPPFLRSQPIHRHRGGSMLNRLITYLGRPPYAIHRLDVNTSGVLLYAKNADVVERIHEQFRRRLVRKEYIAIALGCPAEEQSVVTAPLEKHPHVPTAMHVAPTGKASETVVRVLASTAAVGFERWTEGAAWDSAAGVTKQGACLVTCQPRTGRTHQIRVHLAHAGHPILGDDLYGVTGPWLSRQALHAAAMTIKHPVLRTEVTFRAPLPDDMSKLLQQCGLHATSV